MAFDINDFDETYPGPWEWDLKRLAASAVVAGRSNGFDDKTCQKLAAVACRAYREAMQRLAAKTNLDVWYYHVDADSVVDLFDKYAKKSAKQARKTVKKAQSHTSLHSFDKLTEIVDGERQFINTPPLVVRLSELLTEEQKKEAEDQGSVENRWHSTWLVYRKNAGYC